MVCLHRCSFTHLSNSKEHTNQEFTPQLYRWRLHSDITLDISNKRKSSVEHRCFLKYMFLRKTCGRSCPLFRKIESNLIRILWILCFKQRKNVIQSIHHYKAFCWKRENFAVDLDKALRHWIKCPICISAMQFNSLDESTSYCTI